MHPSAFCLLCFSHNCMFSIISRLGRPCKCSLLEMVKVWGIWWLDPHNGNLLEAVLEIWRLSVCDGWSWLLILNCSGTSSGFYQCIVFVVSLYFSFESCIHRVCKLYQKFLQLEALFLDGYLVVCSISEMISYLRLEIRPFPETKAYFLGHWWPDLWYI